MAPGLGMMDADIECPRNAQILRIFHEGGRRGAGGSLPQPVELQFRGAIVDHDGSTHLRDHSGQASGKVGVRVIRDQDGADGARNRRLVRRIVNHYSCTPAPFRTPR